MKPLWKEVLEPYADLYARMYEELVTHVQSLSPEQVAALRAAINEPTSTNCGWYTYHVAHLIETALPRRADQ